MFKPRRFEILLPLRALDGSGLPGGVFQKIQHDLEYEFSTSTVDIQVIRGFDRKTGLPCEQSVRVVLDAAGTAENLGFFYKYKAALEEQFGAGRVRFTTFQVELL